MLVRGHVLRVITLPADVKREPSCVNSSRQTRSAQNERTRNCRIDGSPLPIVASLERYGAPTVISNTGPLAPENDVFDMQAVTCL
jgi:hypothetical protein